VAVGRNYAQCCDAVCRRHVEYVCTGFQMRCSFVRSEQWWTVVYYFRERGIYFKSSVGWILLRKEYYGSKFTKQHVLT
jgi:hypothetical protein